MAVDHGAGDAELSGDLTAPARRRPARPRDAADPRMSTSSWAVDPERRRPRPSSAVVTSLVDLRAAQPKRPGEVPRGGERVTPARVVLTSCRAAPTSCSEALSLAS